MINNTKISIQFCIICSKPLDQGYLHNDKNVYVRAGPKLCTTDYFTPADEDSALFDKGTDLWDDEAVFPIKVSFNMPRAYFNNLDSFNDKNEQRRRFFRRDQTSVQNLTI